MTTIAAAAIVGTVATIAGFFIIHNNIRSGLGRVLFIDGVIFALPGVINMIVTIAERLTK